MTLFTYDFPHQETPGLDERQREDEVEYLQSRISQNSCHYQRSKRRCSMTQMYQGGFKRLTDVRRLKEGVKMMGHEPPE